MTIGEWSADRSVPPTPRWYEKMLPFEQSLNRYLKSIKYHEHNPHERARDYVRLGNLYIDQGLTEDGRYLTEAIRCYREALQMFSRENYPRDFAGINHNLARCYASLSNLDHDHFEDATRHFGLALEVLDELELYRDMVRTARQLGILQFREQQWASAVEAYRSAIEAGNRMLADAYTDRGQLLEIREAASVYANATYSLLKLGRLDEALKILEQGKARLLARELSLSELTVGRIDPALRQQLRTVNKTILELNQELRTDEGLGSSNDREAINRLKEARLRQKAIVETIRREVPEFAEADLAAHEILAMIPPGAALVAPVVTELGSAIMVIPANTNRLGEEHIVWLEYLTNHEVKAMRRWWQDAYRQESSIASRDWIDRIGQLSEDLWRMVVGPVSGRLRDWPVQAVIFVPQGGLQFFPLHAAWRETNGERRYLLDRLDVSYAPSALSFKVAYARAHTRPVGRALVAGVGKYQSLPPLVFAAEEARSVARIAGAEPLLDVDKATLFKSVTGKGVVHLSCHGAFDWEGEASGPSLFLYDDERVTMAEIVARLDLNETRLATLSACESGIVDSDIPDEAIGLPAGFLQAGAAGVLATLWPVDEESTAVFMEHFYSLLIEEKKSPVPALRETQVWLRDLTMKRLKEVGTDAGLNAWMRLSMTRHLGAEDTPFDAPYFWAGFTITGY